MATDFDRLVGRNIRVLRSVANISQTELAEAIASRGVPMVQQTVAKIETGQRSLRLHEAVAAAEALDVSVAYLAREKHVVTSTRSTSWAVEELPDRIQRMDAELQQIIAEYRQRTQSTMQPTLLDERHAS